MNECFPYCRPFLHPLQPADFAQLVSSISAKCLLLQGALHDAWNCVGGPSLAPSLCAHLLGYFLVNYGLSAGLPPPEATS